MLIQLWFVGLLPLISASAYFDSLGNVLKGINNGQVPIDDPRVSLPYLNSTSPGYSGVFTFSAQIDVTGLSTVCQGL